MENNNTFKKVEDLVEGDYIAFHWKYGNSYSDDYKGELIVGHTSFIRDGSVTVHFMDGYRSEAETVPLDQIIAIGNMETGKTGFKGWTGKFDLVLPEHPIVKFVVKD